MKSVQHVCYLFIGSYTDLNGHSPPSTDSRRVGISYKRKYVHEVLVNRLIKLAQEKVWFVD